MNYNIWEGIYNSFKECPKCGKGFEGETWVSQSLDRTNKLLDAVKENKTISSVVAYRTSLLPFLTALVLEKSENKKVSILDFGGGLGFTYIPVIYGCAEEQSIDYHIVDSKNTCIMGKRIFKNDKRIHFYTSLPQKMLTLDIIHLGSSLQYIEDWKDLINSLAEYRPQYFLFTDLIAGDIPTYVTAQNYYKSKIPCWFFNINDIIKIMSSVNFKLLFKSSYTGNFLGKEQEMPQDNFPEEYRLRNSCNLLFSRGDI